MKYKSMSATSMLRRTRGRGALIVMALFIACSFVGQSSHPTAVVQALRLVKPERQSSLLERLAEQEETEGEENLLEFTKEQVKTLSDKDIDTRLELLEVKLQQSNLIAQDNKARDSEEDNSLVLKDIEPNSDGDFMQSVLDRAEKQREQDEKKQDLESKKEMLQLEKQERKNRQHEVWVMEHKKKKEKERKKEEQKKKDKEKIDREERALVQMEKDAMQAIIDEKNKIVKEREQEGQTTMAQTQDGPHAQTTENENSLGSNREASRRSFDKKISQSLGQQKSGENKQKKKNQKKKKGKKNGKKKNQHGAVVNKK